MGWTCTVLWVIIEREWGKISQRGGLNWDRKHGIWETWKHLCTGQTMCVSRGKEFGVECFRLTGTKRIGRFFYNHLRELRYGIPGGFGSTTTPSIIARFEHLIRTGRQSPIVPFARSTFVSWQLDETVVQAQIVSYRVLPTLTILAIVGKVIHDEAIYTVQCKFASGGKFNCHGDKCNIRIGWFGQCH